MFKSVHNIFNDMHGKLEDPWTVGMKKREIYK